MGKIIRRKLILKLGVHRVRTSFNNRVYSSSSIIAITLPEHLHRDGNVYSFELKRSSRIFPILVIVPRLGIEYCSRNCYIPLV